MARHLQPYKPDCWPIRSNGRMTRPNPATSKHRETPDWADDMARIMVNAQLVGHTLAEVLAMAARGGAEYAMQQIKKELA